MSLLAARSRAATLVAGGMLAAVMVAGCSATGGTPVAGTTSNATPSTPSQPSSSTTAPAPTGVPVGTAVMKVVGDRPGVTIRYRINGGAEQTETGVRLPWEKSFPVYEKLDTEVSADGGDAILACTIVFDGDKLVAYVNDIKPKCDFAYWG